VPERHQPFLNHLKITAVHVIINNFPAMPGWWYIAYHGKIQDYDQVLSKKCSENV